MTALRWTYGVTTVPARRDNLLPTTLRYLAAAGFDHPRLFVDGSRDHWQYKATTGMETTCRYPTIGAYGNWILALAELYIRDPQCDRYALFQDDVLAYRNLRQYLDRQSFPNGGAMERLKGYWNLYTVPSNQITVPSGHKGWFQGRPLNPPEAAVTNPPQKGAGALALVFDREGVQTLLRHQHMIQKPASVNHPKRRIDGAVVEAMNSAGYREYVHSPSLVQHTGVALSTLGTAPRKIAPAWLGKDFDALELLCS